MKKFKKNLIKGLSAFLLAGALFLPNKLNAQERIIIDNFSSPDQIENKLDYHGSGDANNDGIVNFTDYTLMQSGTSNDRTDIDGDGTPSTSNDLSILYDYLNGNISYLPSHLNKINYSERPNYLEDRTAIDKTDTLTITTPDRCSRYSTAFVINFHGFEDLNGINPEDTEWLYTKNGRFNMPVYRVTTNINQPTYHVINAFLVGNNPMNFNDWYFVEPQTDQRVFPGDNNMLVNNPVEIEYIFSINPMISGKFIRWDLDSNGNAVLSEEQPIYFPTIVKNNPNTDNNPPNISVTSPESRTYNTSNISLEGIVTENETFLDEVYYRIDNGSLQYVTCGTPFYSVLFPVNEVSINENLSLGDGEHTLFIYSSDIAKPSGNIETRTINFTISTGPADTTPPNVWDNVPSDWQNSNFNVTLNAEDEGSGVDFIKYCIGTSNNCFPSTEYSSPISVSQEGIRYLRYFAQDNAGNPSDIVSKTLELDKTSPSASDNAPFSWQNSDFYVEINSNDALSGIASTKYYFGSSENGTPSTNYSSPILISQEGENYFKYLTTDNANNASSTTTKTLRLDKTDPEIEILYPENKDYAEEIDSLAFTLKDNYLANNVEYNINGNNYSTSSADTVRVSTTSNEGANKYSVTAFDEAGNSSYSEVNFNYNPTGIEEPILEEFKVYPNPAGNIINFEGIERAKISIYDITGRQLEKRVLEGNNMDISKYSSGIYILRAEDSKGKVYTEKIIKK